MSESKEQGFEIVDKRRLGETEPPQPDISRNAESAATPETSHSSVSTEANAATPDPSETDPELLGPPNVESLLAYMLNLLATSAWQWMGVIMNPETSEATVDIGQARLAIDTFEAVAEKLSPSLDERTRREIQNALADLRVNFVERSTKAPSGGAS
ncbi:MAG: DUF1844 domain-containing protein [Armatimonadetes bacterium]|nr:DUF1844 domain-containing protein [Armatimonadota bacterium]